MVLDELHVFQRRARPESEGHSVPVLMFALVVNGNTRPHPPVHTITASARIVSMRPVELDGDQTAHPAVVDEQGRREPLVVTDYVRICENALNSVCGR